MTKRSCGTCTKCCEGHLGGAVRNIPFYKGNPCHFVTIGKGCTIYAQRPENPCVSYSCLWVKNEDLPEWIKPNEVNAIISQKYTQNNISFIEVVEAGEKLRSDVLSWLIKYCLSNGYNFSWEVDGGKNYIGSPEFLQEVSIKIPIDAGGN